MLESIHSQYEELLKLFTEKKPRELHRITSINEDLLEELLMFLKPFLEATKDLEGEKEPTLHLVVPSIKRLKFHCMVSDDDSATMANLKETAATFLDKKFTPHLLCETAVFMNPRQKSMRVLPASDRPLVIDNISEQLDDLPLRDHRPPTATAEEAPPAKRARHYEEFDDLHEEEVQASELEQYQNIPPAACNLPILTWWKAHSSQLPALSRLARNTLCVMASSSPSERVFSVAGQVVSARRTSLHPSSVNNILLLNSAKKW
jgi:hypothetical protein